MNMLTKTILKIKALNLKRIEQYRLNKKPMKTSEGFYYKGPSIQFDANWEKPERIILSKIFSSYEVFVNIGAHYGYYSCMARGAGLEIVAIEPLPINFKMLMDNIKINNFENNCTLINAAVGSSASIGEISGAFSTATMLKENGNHKSLHQFVPVIKLDTIFHDKNKNKLVLMDVEGYEYEALMGGKKMVALDKNTDWIIEIFPFWEPKGRPKYENKNYFPTFEIMISNGYNIWKISDELERIEPGDLDKTKLDNFENRLSGNFLFSKKQSFDNLNSS
jgi:FkbM family methyltransferase